MNVFNFLIVFLKENVYIYYLTVYISRRDYLILNIEM